MKGYKAYKGYIYFYDTTYHKNSKATKTQKKIRLYILIISFVFAKEKLKLNIKDYPKLL